MPLTRITKKIKPTSLVAKIKQKQRVGLPLKPTSDFRYPYSERKLVLPTGKVLKQKTFLFPGGKNLLIEVGNRGKELARLEVKIVNESGLNYALIMWKETNKEYQGNGIATQMVAEAIYVLKKAGIKNVSLHAIDGFNIYRALGFKERHRFGETYFSKKLNE